MAVKSFKFGQIQRKKSGEGRTVKLGNYSKNPKYATTIEVRIKDGSGNVLYQGTPQYLQIRDPRASQKEGGYQVQDFVLDELVLVTNDE